MRLNLLISLVFLSAACSLGFEKSSEVVDLRVLAVQSEPAEIVLGGELPSTVTVTALVIDPRDPSRTIRGEWRACVPALSTGAGGQTGGPPQAPSGDVDDSPDDRCAETDDSNRLATFDAKLDAISTTVPVPPQIASLVEAGATRGLALSVYVKAHLKLETEGEPLYAIKQVPVSPALPANRTPNRNPRLVALLFDGQLWEPGSPLPVKANACADSEKRTTIDRTRPGEELQVCGHRITPIFDAATSEPYLVQTFDGRTLEQQERLRFAWFVEHGAVTEATSGQPREIGPQKTDPLSTIWLEPPDLPAGGVANLWVVIRDGRGGTSWEQRSIELR